MHLKRTPLLALTVGLCGVAAASVVVAQSGGPFDTSYSTADSGGGTAAGGSYSLQISLGQAVAGDEASGRYSLAAGVLAGGAGAAAPVPSPTPGALTNRGFGPELATDGVVN